MVGNSTMLHGIDPPFSIAAKNFVTSELKSMRTLTPVSAVKFLSTVAVLARVVAPPELSYMTTCPVALARTPLGQHVGMGRGHGIGAGACRHRQSRESPEANHHFLFPCS